MQKQRNLLKEGDCNESTLANKQSHFNWLHTFNKENHKNQNPPMHQFPFPPQSRKNNGTSPKDQMKSKPIYDGNENSTIPVIQNEQENKRKVFGKDIRHHTRQRNVIVWSKWKESMDDSATETETCKNENKLLKIKCEELENKLTLIQDENQKLKNQFSQLEKQDKQCIENQHEKKNKSLMSHFYEFYSYSVDFYEQIKNMNLMNQLFTLLLVAYDSTKSNLIKIDKLFSEVDEQSTQSWKKKHDEILLLIQNTLAQKTYQNIDNIIANQQKGKEKAQTNLKSISENISTTLHQMNVILQEMQNDYLPSEVVGTEKKQHRISIHRVNSNPNKSNSANANANANPDYKEEEKQLPSSHNKCLKNVNVNESNNNNDLQLQTMPIYEPFYVPPNISTRVPRAKTKDYALNLSNFVQVETELQTNILNEMQIELNPSSLKKSDIIKQ